MRKLTPEEIYPYLPYDVECATTNGKGDITRGIVDVSNVLDLVRFHNVKLALRPLSDLNKKETEELALLLNMTIPRMRAILAFQKFQELRYSHVIKLLKNHYDIFGLIPAGLAIDKNTIE